MASICIYLSFANISKERGRYGWGYINYLFKNRKHIQQQIKINKTLIDNFLKLNVENRT